MNRNERRKLRKAASKAHCEMGQETASKARWIRYAETKGLRKMRKQQRAEYADYAVHIDSPKLDLSKLEPGVHNLRPSSSFLLSEMEGPKPMEKAFKSYFQEEVERAAEEDLV